MYLFFNGKFYQHTDCIITAESKAFRYGELVFETIRFSNGKSFFITHHLQRLVKAASLLNIIFPKHFTTKLIELHIEKLLQKNELTNARVRVTIFKGIGGLFEDEAGAFNITIETYPLADGAYTINENGLAICFFDAHKKGTNTIDNYKTGNHLIYNLAAQYAKQQKCNQALLYNYKETICDATISNIFLVRTGHIITPPLQDGAIDGIMRQYIMQNATVVEQSITKEDVLTADEVFLTNAVNGIQWVKRVEDKLYGNEITLQLYHSILKKL